MKQKRYCVICNKPAERHHVFPRTHFWGKKGEPTHPSDKVVVNLCHDHHLGVENMICANEGTRNGKRVKRSRQFYLNCLVAYLTDENIQGKATP